VAESEDLSMAAPHSPLEGTFTAQRHDADGPILIVEDDEDSRFVYRVIFEANGLNVLLATSGDEGLRIAREIHPRAILLDVSIPGMDGWTVAEHLKGDPATVHIPVVVITAHAFPEDRRRAQETGCDGFLTKPCEPGDVLAAIRKHIDRKHIDA
jgi:CheY-like chemotaxis protein